MSELDPGHGILSVLFAVSAFLLGLISWFFRRQIKRVDVIEEKYIPEERYEKTVNHLNGRINDTVQIFMKEHDKTRKNVDKIVDDFKKEHSDTRKEMRDGHQKINDTLIKMLREDKGR